MGSTLLRRSLVAAIAILSAAGCGYEATATSIELRATPADGGPSVPFALSGTSDPEASAFSTGIMLWTRWATNRDGVRTVELFIDLNRDHLPADVDADEAPEVLRGDDQVVATLRGRDSRGEVILEQRASSAQVQVDRFTDSGARELSQGSFSLVWPADGPYLDIVGSWETLPRPPTPSTRGGGDFTPSPGDSVRTGDAARPVGDDDDIITFDSAGCACTGEVDEEIPDEPVEPEPEPAPDDTAQGTGGCDCQGDTVDDEPTDPDPDPTSEEDSGGCDCEGDPGPDDESTALRSSTARVARIKRRCRRGPLRMGMELSPLFFIWGLSVYRRRRQ